MIDPLDIQKQVTNAAMVTMQGCLLPKSSVPMKGSILLPHPVESI